MNERQANDRQMGAAAPARRPPAHRRGARPAARTAAGPWAAHGASRCRRAEPGQCKRASPGRQQPAAGCNPDPIVDEERGRSRDSRGRPSRVGGRVRGVDEVGGGCGNGAPGLDGSGRRCDCAHPGHALPPDGPRGRPSPARLTPQGGGRERRGYAGRVREDQDAEARAHPTIGPDGPSARVAPTHASRADSTRRC